MTKQSEVPGLGERLKLARDAAGLSQGQAAKLLGLHRPTITNIEAEERKVTAGELKAFAELYKVSVEWLLGEPSKDHSVKMAARKLSTLKDKDLETVIRIIDSLRRGKQ